MNIARSAAALATLGFALEIPACTTTLDTREDSQVTALGARRVHVAAMGPLFIGRLEAPHDPALEPEWSAFEADLAQAKALGVESVSIDVWWGGSRRRSGVLAPRETELPALGAGKVR